MPYSADSLDVRPLHGPEELPEWLRAMATGFLRSAPIGPEQIAQRAPGIDLARTQGAWDDGRCVATFRTTPQQLTVPGGTALPACAVTNVTVTATHRRRGLLSRMMADALDAAKERGDAMASLTAAEYPIYGRYGFGPAAWISSWEVSLGRTGLDRRHAGPADLGDPGRIDLVTPEELLHTLPAVHDRFRSGAHRQGTIDRTARWWENFTGRHRYPGDGFTPAFHAVYRDGDGIPQGAATYSVDDRWDGHRPDNTLQVHDLFATSTAAETALWRYLLATDWVQTLRTGPRAPDDVLPHLLPDPRAARVTSFCDLLWLRPLDVPRMLESRSYSTPGTLVLDIHDADGYTGGRFRLEAGPDGARCTTTRDEPDLSLDVGELACLYLGDETAVRLAQLGRLTEHRAGAAESATLLLRTARRPWCPDTF